VGQIHPELAAELDLPEATFLFELDAQFFLEREPGERRYQPPSRFPALTRDLNVIVDRETPAWQCTSKWPLCPTEK